MVKDRTTSTSLTADDRRLVFISDQHNGKSTVPYVVQYLPDGITVTFP